MSEGHFNSRARKPANTEPDYWTSAQLSEPARKLLDAQAKIARELGLNERLRQRLSDEVRLYIDATQATSEAPRPKQGEVRRRLKQIKAATSNLRKFFTENARAAAARAELKAFEDRGYGFAAITPGWKEALSDDNLRGLKESAAKLYELLGRKSVYVDGIDVLLMGLTCSVIPLSM